MIYILRGLYDVVCEMLRPITHPQPQPAGEWWFTSQDETDWATAFAVVAEHHGDDDGSGPMPESYGSDRPKCKTCGGPNFSLEDDECLICRLGMI